MDVCSKGKTTVEVKKKSSCHCFGKLNETRYGRVREDGEQKCAIVCLFISVEGERKR